MLIKDACEKCRLTKKAIEYYERRGLIHPKADDNGYRRYSQADISALKEISLLRKLGISVADIGRVLSSGDKPKALERCRDKLALDLERMRRQRDCLDRLIGDYDVERAALYAESGIEEGLTIKERLLRAFPGGYGTYLCVHFGRFLEHEIDSPEKRAAYAGIIEFIDDVPMYFSKELEAYLQEVYDAMEQTQMEQIDGAVAEALEDIDGYIDRNRDAIEGYLVMRASEEYKATPAYRLQELLLEFNRTSGYYDVFIHNLKILSNSYCQYAQKLEQANAALLEKMPQAGALYDR